jgi:SAM-dependent methyltransferase
MLNRLLFWKRPVDPIVEHEGIFFPVSTLQILLAQSASAEVRRRFEPEGNVFETVKVNPIFQRAFIESYMQANLNYFQLIKPQIPTACRRVLDIGCGIGLLDLLIYRSARGKKPTLYMFDKSVDPATFSTPGIAPTGFNERYVFTSSLEQSARFLRLNGVSDDDIVPCEVGAWKIRNGGPFDLIFSRKSWGFHYPLTEYLAEVALSLDEQGVLITDVRTGQGAEEQLHKYFSYVDVLEHGRKSALMIANTARMLR